MGRLFVLFFLLPWWAYVPASLGVLWLGERVYEQALETEAEKAAALEIGRAGRRSISANSTATATSIPPTRFTCVGMIDHELDYELVERTNGVPTSTRHLYMIFGSDGPDPRWCAPP